MDGSVHKQLVAAFGKITSAFVRGHSFEGRGPSPTPFSINLHDCVGGENPIGLGLGGFDWATGSEGPGRITPHIDSPKVLVADDPTGCRVDLRIGESKVGPDRSRYWDRWYKSLARLRRRLLFGEG